MSISMFSAGHTTNMQIIYSMSTERFAQFMFDYGVDCCNCCKYKKKCDGKSCEYNSMTTDVEIIKDWLESNYD